MIDIDFNNFRVEKKRNKEDLIFSTFGTNSTVVLRFKQGLGKSKNLIVGILTCYFLTERRTNSATLTGKYLHILYPHRRS